jgi:hypothetical protein
MNLLEHLAKWASNRLPRLVVTWTVARATAEVYRARFGEHWSLTNAKTLTAFDVQEHWQPRRTELPAFWRLWSGGPRGA